MNEKGNSKKAQALKLASLETTFYLYEDEKHNVEFSSAATFDAWVLTFVDEIVKVNRQVWDIYSRWKFVNWLLEEGLARPVIEEFGVLIVEEKSSSEDAENVDELAQEAG